MGKIIPVILCGGAGTRHWPLSQAKLPKQFLNLIDPEKSLLQTTFERVLGLPGVDHSSIIIVTHQNHVELVKEHLAGYAPIILTETHSRNTAPAVALATKYVRENLSSEDILFTLPCDGHIVDEKPLYKAADLAIQEAEKGRIAIFGVKPTRPETGYGYIKTGTVLSNGVYHVDQFVEKPDQPTAMSYLHSGDYLWNSGMAIFRASSLWDAFEIHAPHIIKNLDDYESLKALSLDVAVLEKSACLSVVPCAMEWSDVGTWTGLLEILKKTSENDAFANKFKRLGN